MKTTTRLLPVLLLVFLPALATLPSAAQISAMGAEFLVDEEPRFAPYCPEVAGRGDRGFTVAWGAERSSLHARSYNGAGEPLGPPIVVDEGRLEGYNLQEVAVQNRPGQGDLVVWSSDLISVSDPFRHDRRVVFPAPGPVSRVEAPRYVEQVSPRRTGGFLAAWRSRRSWVASALDGAGKPVGQPVRISSGPPRGFLELAHAADGSFTAVWHGEDLRLRRFGADLRPLGPEVEVIPGQEDINRLLVASGPDGRTAVVWPRNNLTRGWVVLVVRFFGPDGQPESDPQRVLIVDRGGSVRPEAIAVDRQGRALIVWSQNLPDAPHERFRLQLWSSAGPASGSQPLSHTPFETELSPSFCASAAAAGRSWVVTWLADAPDGETRAIYARRFFSLN